MRKLDINTFIEASNLQHDNKFNYELVEYKNVRTKVKIICPNCGIFEQLPWVHMKGNGCRTCNIQTKTSFIEKSIKIHGCKYNYDLCNFINNTIPIKIICSKHGIFEQTPQNHIKGSGCTKCFRDRKISNTSKFVAKSNIIHNNLYDYSLTKYKNNKEKVKIICPKHNVFEQQPNHHLNGSGCPRCNNSKGELFIEAYLLEHNIRYERQKTFNNCSNKSKLRFDFYLLDYNICIEYNGLQHYENVEYFGGYKEFKERQKRDIIKSNFCIDNNIKLLIIKYNDDICNILMKLFNLQN